MSRPMLPNRRGEHAAATGPARAQYVCVLIRPIGSVGKVSAGTTKVEGDVFSLGGADGTPNRDIAVYRMA